MRHKGRWQKRRRAKTPRQKTMDKIAIISPSIPVISVNVNHLETPI